MTERGPSARECATRRSTRLAAATLLLFACVACDAHKPKCEDAVRRLGREQIEAGRAAAGTDNTKLLAFWTSVARDAEQGQQECTAAKDTAKSSALGKVLEDAKHELQLQQERAEEAANEPARTEWKKSYCRKSIDKAFPVVSTCCSMSSATAWKKASCEGTERSLVALLGRAATLCKALAGVDCTLDDSALVDGSIVHKGGAWSVRYCPESTCIKSAGELDEIARMIGGPGPWHREGFFWGVTYTGSGAPKLSAEQDRLMKKYFDMGPTDSTAP